MSQDPPNPPESERPTPETPPPEPAREPTPTPVPPTGDRRPSALKTLTISTLRSTINFLEGVVEKLEEEPVNALPSQPNVPISARQPIAGVWATVLGKIRAVLPESVNQKLSDWGLTGAIAAILVLAVSTTLIARPGNPPPIAPVPPEPSDVYPVPSPKLPEISELPPPEPKPPAGITTPPELTAPEPSQPIEIEPLPLPELTPEQTLIAAIQNEVGAVTSKYANGLIESIQANFEGSLLLVKISNEWYNIQSSRQDKLAAEMLERSRELDFRTVEITDSQGSLVARSPVVGSQMIILKRTMQNQG